MLCIFIAVAVCGTARSASATASLTLEVATNTTVTDRTALWISHLLARQPVDAATEGDAPTTGGTSFSSVLLSGVGGALSATGANILAWSSQRKEAGADWARRYDTCFYIACFVLNLLGIFIFAYACASGGAVATVMPIQTGANLVTNMILQIGLGLKPYNKNMRLGTLILMCAVAMLAEIGPKEPEYIDVIALIGNPIAAAWIAFLVICTALSLVAAYATANHPRRSYSKLISLTAVISLTTVIGSSVSKCFGLLEGFTLLAALAIYFVDGVVLMGFTLVANAQCDVSLYIPLQLSSQLVINMFTGLFAWGDSKTLTTPVAYSLVYVISVMAVYLISSDLDVIGVLVQLHRIKQSKLSDGVARTPFGAATLHLLRVWEKHRDQGGNRQVEEPAEHNACEEALLEALRCGREAGAIREEDLASLVSVLLAEHGVGPSAAVVHWIERDLDHLRRYLRHDPAFEGAFKKTLHPSEAGRLPALDKAAEARLRKASNAWEQESSASTSIPLTATRSSASTLLLASEP